MSDIDTRLRHYARRWQSEQSAPAPFDPSHSTWSRPSRGGDRRRLTPLIVALAAVCAVVAGAVALLPGRNSVKVSAGGNAAVTFVRSGVPIAAPPLLAQLPNTTEPILVSSGHSGPERWMFYAQVSALTADPAPQTNFGVNRSGPPTHLGAGLCLMMATERTLVGGGSTIGCDDPAKMPSLTREVSLLHTDSHQVLVYGVTSASAASMVVSFRENLPPVAVTTRSTSELPGLRFYVVESPPGADPASVEVEALAGDGTPLVRSDPGPPPAPPIVTPSVPIVTPSLPDAYPLWPLDPADIADRSSAEAVARAFSASALGVTGNDITPDPAAVPNSPTAVTIELPSSGRPLRALASPSHDGTWTIIQAGDQTQLRGIAFGPSGPTMAIKAPADASEADITELADGRVQHVHLTQADLRAGSARLTGQSIHSVLIVFRNSAGATVDAIGGVFD